MRRPFCLDERGTASAEMALVLPMLLVLMFGGMEAGHFVWTQHKLADGVRDGARYAARLNINDLCNGSTVVMSSDTEDTIKLLTRTGQVDSSSALAKVPGWSDSQVSVQVDCDSTEFVSTGIYSDLGGPNGPIVKVSASGVTYPSLLHRLGFLDSTIRLAAESNAPVTGL